MSGNRRVELDPNLLFEAARVFNAAGGEYERLVLFANELALQSREKAAPDVQAAIVGDAAAMRLTGRVGGGYRGALDLLQTIGEDQDGRLHLLRALARVQEYKEGETGASATTALASAPAAANALETSIVDDLKFAFAKNRKLEDDYNRFWSSGESSPIDLKIKGFAAAATPETANDPQSGGC